MALATRTEMLKAVPGRSQCPGTWAAIYDARKKFDAYAAGNGAPDLSFEWIPRSHNAFADELCNAAMDNRAPNFSTLRMLPVPDRFAAPSAEELDSICRRCVSGSTGPTWRSMPLQLKVTWHAILARVSQWGPVALLLAPVVLLQRFGEQPFTRLQRMAATPQLIEMHYWNAAHEEEDHPPERQRRQTAFFDSAENMAAETSAKARKLEMVERMAAHSPSKAVKLLFGSPAASPEEATESARKKFTALHDEVPDGSLQMPCRLPDWIHADQLIAAVATRMARAAAPGVDGWTRELLLASFCKPTVPVFETLANAIARNSLPHWPAALLRSARVAAWSRPKKDHRIIGMTSCVTKAVWKLLTAQHMLHHRLAKNLGAFTAGGVLAIIRWANSAYERGEALFTGDVDDAYWNVDRKRLHDHLAEKNSPLTFIFRLCYASPAIALHGSLKYTCGKGLLPGCGGASILYAIDTSFDIMRGELSNPSKSAIFADDVTSTDAATFSQISAALAPKKLSKIAVLCKEPNRVPSEFAGSRVRAMRLLGGFVGDEAEASKLFSDCVLDKLSTMRDVVSQPGLSIQARWAMLRSLEAGIRWRFMATAPNITMHDSQRIDDLIADYVFKLLPRDAVPNHKSRTLLYIPLTSGGLGFVQFNLHAADLYAATTAMAVWPPVPVDQSGGLCARAVTVRTAYQVLREKFSAAAQDVLGPHEAKTRHDLSTPWFCISALTKHLRINDEAWGLQMANYLKCAVPYPTCGAASRHSLTFDHSMCCHKCGAPYRTPRHSGIISAFRSVASQFGIQCSENFFHALGVQPTGKRPDVIVYRAGRDLKPLVFDMSAPHQPTEHHFNSVVKQYAAKLHKYSAWKPDLIEFKPFIITPLGHLHPQTKSDIEGLDGVACRKGFSRECINRIKVALTNFEVYRRAALVMRSNCGTLDAHVAEPAQDPASDGEGDLYGESERPPVHHDRDDDDGAAIASPPPRL